MSCFSWSCWLCKMFALFSLLSLTTIFCFLKMFPYVSIMLLILSFNNSVVFIHANIALFFWEFITLKNRPIFFRFFLSVWIINNLRTSLFLCINILSTFSVFFIWWCVTRNISFCIFYNKIMFFQQVHVQTFLFLSFQGQIIICLYKIKYYRNLNLLFKL